MNKRRWIIQKYMRRCSNHSRCVGYDKANAKVTVVDAEKGIVETTCRECGQKETHQADKFKERRPCPRCRDVFDFTISLWKSPGSDEVTEHWSRRCKICEMEVSAAGHLAQGRAFLAKARELRDERKRRKELRKRGTVEGLVADEISRGAAPALATSQTIRELVAAEKDLGS